MVVVYESIKFGQGQGESVVFKRYVKVAGVSITAKSF